MNSSKKKYYNYIFDLIIVMFGVFFGILISEWNTNRNMENLSRINISSIISELEGNSKKLSLSIKYHEQLFHSIDSIWAKTNQSELNKFLFENKGFSQIPNWNGIGMNHLSNSSFNSALISNIFPGMLPKVVENITKTYRDIESYNSIREKILDRFYDIDSQTKYMDLLLILEIIKGDVTGFEVRLKKDTEDLINFLQKEEF